MRKILVALFVLFSTPVFAQTISPQVQKILEVLTQQRNNALNAQALAEANLATVSEDLTKTQERIKELEKKSDDKPKE